MGHQEMLPPLLYMKKGNRRVSPVLKIIDEEGKEYDVVKVIEKIVSEILPEISSSIASNPVSTFSTYILCETLYRLEMYSSSDAILSSPAEIYKAALYSSVGFLAGRMFPEGLDFNDEEEDITAIIRALLTTEGNEKEDS